MLRWVVAAGFVVLTTAALADSKSDCLDSRDHELRIKGCSAIILRNPKDVIAYHNRGEAYGLKGDLDRAIADYNRAIELNPNYAPAYNSRGRAYTSKGDYVHAVAWSPDGTRLVSGSGDFTVRVWDSLSAQERAKRLADKPTPR